MMDLIRYYATVDGQEQLTIFLCENYRGHPSFLMVRQTKVVFHQLSFSWSPHIYRLHLASRCLAHCFTLIA